jgi:signal transduction histidine kinase
MLHRSAEEASRLPCSPRPATSHPPASPTTLTAADDAKILIVDDEPANIVLLERLLETKGYRHIWSTSDSRTALSLYRSHEPDLILLDLLMPHLDGVAVLQQLRAETGAAYVPVLVLTADATPAAKLRALDAGADDFVTKPFEQVEVLLRIRNLLRTRCLHRALQAQNESLEATVRHRTEQLLQSEKVATMGSLLAGVAHELNNPLAVLLGHTELLKRGALDAALAERAEKIGAAAARCGRIVKNFLALARQHPPERGDVVLNQVVRDAVELLAYELRTDNVRLTLTLAEDLPHLWADAHQLHQVVINLLANAYHALRRSALPRQISITTRSAVATGDVRLEIADSGPGIPPEIRTKIFEPFFTTKAPGEGTGLGLSLCRGIVEDHGGAMTVESEVGRGTTFAILLPVIPRPSDAAASSVETERVAVGPKHILVVDDEPDVAEVLIELLKSDGHRVEHAANGAEALQRLEQQAFDLVLSDTKMPVMDGVTFYRELERRFPALRHRVVFVTGDALDAEKRRSLESIEAPYLMKPFDLAVARDLVRRHLAGTAVSA